jgi:Fe-S cluster assembly iron-binding protein IscA
LNLSLEERKITGDLLFEFEGLNILIHEQDFVYFDHTKLDYVEDVLGKSSFTLLKI